MPSEDHAPATIRSLDRYESLLTETGELVIYDRDQPSAWITSEQYVVLGADPPAPGEQPPSDADAADDALDSR